MEKYFNINKTKDLLSRKYYWLSFQRDIEVYVKSCDICLDLNAVKYKLYGDLQSLLVLTHWWKRLFDRFYHEITDFNQLERRKLWLHPSHCWPPQKIVHYELVKVIINALRLAEVVLNVVVWYHGFPNSIVSDRSSLFISKFWSSLRYFFSIKWRLSTTFHPQTDNQIKQQNSTIEDYLQAFVNFKQNDWAKLLWIAKFTYNNARNTSIGHTLFELNCNYHPRMLYEEKVDPYSKSKSANKLSAELRKLMIVCRENFYHAQEL